MFSINLAFAVANDVGCVSLHSTMFSINLVAENASPSCETLYIPLCFLLIHAGYTRITAVSNLYIPLCFLLISPEATPPFLAISLYIPLCFLLISMPFHIDYSSTSLYIPLCFLLIPEAPSPALRFPALHSTMFSINLMLISTSLRIYSSLHSTMFSINLHRPGGHL